MFNARGLNGEAALEELCALTWNQAHSGQEGWHTRDRIQRNVWRGMLLSALALVLAEPGFWRSVLSSDQSADLAPKRESNDGLAVPLLTLTELRTANVYLAEIARCARQVEERWLLRGREADLAERAGSG